MTQQRLNAALEHLAEWHTSERQPNLRGDAGLRRYLADLRHDAVERVEAEVAAIYRYREAELWRPVSYYDSKRRQVEWRNERLHPGTLEWRQAVAAASGTHEEVAARFKIAANSVKRFRQELSST